MIVVKVALRDTRYQNQVYMLLAPTDGAVASRVRTFWFARVHGHALLAGPRAHYHGIGGRSEHHSLLISAASSWGEQDACGMPGWMLIRT